MKERKRERGRREGERVDTENIILKNDTSLASY